MGLCHMRATTLLWCCRCFSVYYCFGLLLCSPRMASILRGGLEEGLHREEHSGDANLWLDGGQPPEEVRQHGLVEGPGQRNPFHHTDGRGVKY